MTGNVYVKGYTIDDATGIKHDVDVLLSSVKDEKSDHRHALIAGAVAGDHTVTGIDVGDTLDEVLLFHVTAGATDNISDLTGECTISALNTINNALGTTSAGSKLLVRWTKK